MAKTSKPPFRLPSFIRPESYHLSINPDLTAQTFSGTVTIKIQIKKKTSVVYLHAKDLVIQQALVRQDKTALETSIKYIKEDEVVAFSLPKSISGEWEIYIAFTGIIHADLRGFYISTHIHEGKEERIGATQFEAVDARRAFPCFDEPDMKAIFNLRIQSDKNHEVLANTQTIEKNNLPENRIEHVFAPSPVMSTYLLAWCIGRFENINGKSRRRAVVSINVPLGKKHAAKFALDTAIKSLDFFEDYFGIRYPLKKLDLVALPDFASGAMENWGLITFRETALLVDKNNTALTNMQWVALVIAHEIAHQWFGNLVTMKWWDDLWLNEGFANYIEYLCIDNIFPEWKIWEDFTQGDMGDALRLDALQSSHPIEVPIKDAKDIDEIFDDITYRKGASVIRMLAEYTGKKDFQKGIREYMKEYAYKNATTKDLWRHLEHASGKPVSVVMGAWTRQAGFPLIEVHEKSGKIYCNQCRYYRNRLISKKENDKTLWPIPLDDGKKTHLMPKKKSSVIDTYDNAITLNDKESSLAHIVYPESFINRQKDALLQNSLSSLQRMGLIRNMRALTESGHYTVVELVEFIQLFKNERDHLVVSELWGALLRLQHVFGKDKELSIKITAISIDIFEKIWEHFSWDSKKREERLLSSIILSAAYKLSNKEIVEQSLERFRKGKDTIPTHLRAGTYRIVVRYGNEKDNKNLWKLLEDEKLHEEKMRIMASFAAVPKLPDLMEVLRFYTGEKVKSQDTPILIARLLMETDHPEIIFTYIQKQYGFFIDRYGKGGHLLSRLLGALAAVRDEVTLKEMKKFFKKYPAPGCTMTLDQAYEKIEGALAWHKADVKLLQEYLK